MFELVKIASSSHWKQHNIWYEFQLNLIQGMIPRKLTEQPKTYLKVQAKKYPVQNIHPHQSNENGLQWKNMYI